MNKLDYEPKRARKPVPLALVLAALFLTVLGCLTLTRQANTATIVATSEKNDARNALIAEARLLISIVNGHAVSDTQKLELGITVPKQPSPQPAPAFAPDIDFRGVTANVVSIRVHNSQTFGTHGRPPGVQGAAIYTFTGPVPPMDYKEWRFYGNATRTSTTVEFDPLLPPGTKAWISAAWYNVRGEGPLAFPVETPLLGPVTAQPEAA